MAKDDELIERLNIATSDIAELKAERERLREVLREIAAVGWGDCFSEARKGVMKCERLARSALSNPPSGQLDGDPKTK